MTPASPSPSPSNWSGPVPVAKKWHCALCGAENKRTALSCDKCYHTPYQGSRQQEADRERAKRGSGCDE